MNPSTYGLLPLDFLGKIQTLRLIPLLHLLLPIPILQPLKPLFLQELSPLKLSPLHPPASIPAQFLPQTNLIFLLIHQPLVLLFHSASSFQLITFLFQLNFSLGLDMFQLALSQCPSLTVCSPPFPLSRMSPKRVCGIHFAPNFQILF